MLLRRPGVLCLRRMGINLLPDDFVTAFRLGDASDPSMPLENGRPLSTRSSWHWIRIPGKNRKVDLPSSWHEPVVSQLRPLLSFFAFCSCRALVQSFEVLCRCAGRISFAGFGPARPRCVAKSFCGCFSGYELSRLRAFPSSGSLACSRPGISCFAFVLRSICMSAPCRRLYCLASDPCL